MPVAGGATTAVGTAGAAAAATVWVVSALRAVVVENACAAGTALDSVLVADGFSVVVPASAAPTEVAGGETLTAADRVESDLVLAGVDVGCSASGSGVAGGALGCSVGSTVSPEETGSLDSGWVSTPLVDVGAVDASDSVVLVCAPPLLLIVTPDET
jgi:hypothetical protein